MVKNLIPAFVALFVAIILSGLLAKSGAHEFDEPMTDLEQKRRHYPSSKAMLGPSVVIALLALRSNRWNQRGPVITPLLGRSLVTIVVTRK